MGKSKIIILKLLISFGVFRKTFGDRWVRSVCRQVTGTVLSDRFLNERGFVMRNRLFFVLLLLAVTSLGSPGSSAQNRSVSAPVEVVRCDSLTVYYPRFSRMDLATGSMPSKTDSTVIFCCAAAFTAERSAISHLTARSICV